MKKPLKKQKVAFVHGRPHGHPLHAAYAKSVEADFYHEDRLLTWHDNPSASKARRYLSWLLNALFFPHRKEYDVILTECIRIPQYLMKKMGLISGDKKLVALMSDESLFFIESGKYSKATIWLMKSFLNSVDGLICVGHFQADLAKKFAPKQKIKTIFNGIGKNSYKSLEKLTYNSNTNKILFIGNVDADWRAEYKGLDLAIQAVVELSQIIPEIQLTIVGSISEALIAKNEENSEKGLIHFVGKRNDLAKYIDNHSLCLHPSRGEAWGVSISEAMLAGIPAIVSEHTGMKEVVAKTDMNLIVKSNIESTKAAILWFFDLSADKKQELSKKSRDAVKSCTEESAVKLFHDAFFKIVN